MEFLTTLLANCSRSFRFEGCQIKIWTHYWPLQNSPALWLHSFLGAVRGNVWGHCPVGTPMTSDAAPAFWHWALHCTYIVFRFYDALHTDKASSARGSNTPQNHHRPSMFDCRYCVLFCIGLISLNRKMMSFTKNLYLGLICSQHVLPGFWLPQVYFGKSTPLLLCQQWGAPHSPAIAFYLVQMSIDNSNWHCCTLSLENSLYLFGSWMRLFIHYVDYPSLQAVIYQFFLIKGDRQQCHVLWTCCEHEEIMNEQILYSSPQTILRSSFCSPC